MFESVYRAIDTMPEWLWVLPMAAFFSVAFVSLILLAQHVDKRRSQKVKNQRTLASARYAYHAYKSPESAVMAIIGPALTS